MEETQLGKNNYMSLEHTYMQLPEKFFFKQAPSPVPHPKLVIFNKELAKEIGIGAAWFKSEEGINVLAGNKIISETIAQAYAGHQFGYFTMLGDGRAILLGEYVTKEGKRYDIQLKGSGRTPYSRRGDGKAALGPMLREYIISEAMHALGIPTSRSLAVVTTGEKVMREQPLEGAILTRLAKSHIRVGTFEYAARYGDKNELKALADYTLARHFKEEQESANPYLYLLKRVVARQARLIAKWQLVGFIHGVMNTDNMLVSGETIDYGPCAFMDTYALQTVFSSIDKEGRYAYGNQPIMAAWNLARFAETLLPLIDENKDKAVELAENEVKKFEVIFKEAWQEGMYSKLGLFKGQEGDSKLAYDLLRLMAKYQADYTNTFRLLTLGEEDRLAFAHTADFKAWREEWKKRVASQNIADKEVMGLMMTNNPYIIPRNHRVEEALEAAVNHQDMHVMEALLMAVTHPYDYSGTYEDYTNVTSNVSCGYKTFCGT